MAQGWKAAASLGEGGLEPATRPASEGVKWEKGQAASFSDQPLLSP